MAYNNWVNPFYQTHKDLQDSVMQTYGESVAQNKNELGTGSDYLSKSYQNTIDQLNQGLQGDVSDLTNSSASKGSFGSTAYNERLNSLANKYNTSATGAFDTSSYKSSNLGQQYQPNLGMTVQSQTPVFNKFQASPTAQVGQTSQQYRYNPFQQAGSGLNNTKVLNLNKINY